MISHQLIIFPFLFYKLPSVLPITLLPSTGASFRGSNSQVFHLGKSHPEEAEENRAADFLVLLLSTARLLLELEKQLIYFLSMLQDLNCVPVTRGAAAKLLLLKVTEHLLLVSLNGLLNILLAFCVNTSRQK